MTLISTVSCPTQELLLELKVDSSYDPFRDDPRFHDLLLRMNLEQ